MKGFSFSNYTTKEMWTDEEQHILEAMLVKTNGNVKEIASALPRRKPLLVYTRIDSIQIGKVKVRLNAAARSALSKTIPERIFWPESDEDTLPEILKTHGKDSKNN